MVNHFATLLLNHAGEDKSPDNKSYFIAHEYLPLTLPSALRDFYYLLFPQNSSFYYKQFLCYCFLRVIQATHMQDHLLKHDNRLTYDLDDLNEYFRLNRISVPTASSAAFNLIVLGKYAALLENNYYFNSYTVLQNGNLPEVFVYSDVDKVFLKKDKTSTSRLQQMSIPLEISTFNLTKAVAVGTTGLSFVLTGDFQNSLTAGRFTDTVDKSWNFIVESPFTFEFVDFYKRLLARDTMVARMINYGENKNTSYLNLWNNHFNEAYKFSGLLNLYIDKVHDVWGKNQT